jgi:hypothetical protein
MREAISGHQRAIRGSSAWIRTEMPRCTTRLLQSGGHAHAALHSYTGIPGWTRKRPCLSYLTRGVLTGHQGGTHWPSGGHSLAIRGPSKAINGHQRQSRGHQRQSRGHQRPSGSHQRQSRGPSTAIREPSTAIKEAINGHQGAINGNQGRHQRPLSAIEANQRTRCRPTAPAARGSIRIGSHSNNSLGRSRRILRGSPQASRARHHLQLPTSAGR